MFEVLTTGGYILYLIIICSLIAVAVTIQRYVLYRRFEYQISSYNDKLDNRTLGSFNNYENPLARLWKTLQNGCSSIANSNTALETFLIKETLHLEKYLFILATIATIAPLLGLLGTVFGMIKTFHAAAASGISNPKLLAEGIAEALYNTAAGLSVTIFCIVAHNSLRNWAERLSHSLEARAGELQALFFNGGNKDGV